MLYLIEYDRGEGRLVSLRRFEDRERSQAVKVRIDLEVQLQRRGDVREVVLLEAASEEALRKTHRRYFEDLGTLTTGS